MTIHLLVLLLFFKFHIDDFLKNGTKVLPLFPSHWLHRLWWWILYWPRFLRAETRWRAKCVNSPAKKLGVTELLAETNWKVDSCDFHWHFYVDNIVSWSPDLIVKRALVSILRVLVFLIFGSILFRSAWLPYEAYSILQLQLWWWKVADMSEACGLSMSLRGKPRKGGTISDRSLHVNVESWKNCSCSHHISSLTG